MEEFDKNFLECRRRLKNIKRDIPKDYKIDSNKLEIQHAIYTQSTCFVFGDKEKLNNYMKNDVPQLDYIDYFSEGVELFHEFFENSNKHKFIDPNVFSLSSKGSKFSPIYMVMMDINKDRRIKHLFIPTFCFSIINTSCPDVFYMTNKSKKKREFKQSLEKFINPIKNEWVFMRDLKIPSGALVIDNHNYVQGKEFHTEWTKIFGSKKEFKVYAVISKKSKLLEFYNSQDPEIQFDEKIIHEPYENLTFKPSGLLEGDKTFHGIMLF
tara:strand:+ start:651 stop:1451 length:801 start_codon:yes stop_codon:yes gene_type:complete